MWCRAILTAVAISYVICMLLWSGLQKEDLDANTLDKLRRYNVNIDDMNNEQRRRECLLDQITEVQREALRTSATDRTENDPVNVGIYPKIGMLLAANFEDKAVVQFNSNDTKGNFEQVHINAEKLHDMENVTNVDGNKAVIKIEYNVQNQPNVESVMNFWTQLTHHKTTTASLPVTIAAPVTKLAHFKTDKANNGTETVTAETQNDGYVHSREMEYISRILAEYLASKTVPTTTESSSLKKKFTNYVPTKYWEISNKVAVNEESKVGKQGYEINKINTTQDKANNFMKDEGKIKPFKDKFDSELLKIIQETATSQAEPKGRESKQIGRSNAKGFLNRLLRMKNDLFNNGFVIPETDFEVQPIKKNYEPKEKSEPFNLLNLFQNMNDANKNNSHNFTINSSQSTNASIKDDTMTTNEPEVALGPINKKKSQVHQNLNLEHRESRFQAMLPSIKYSKQNKISESVNSEVIGISKEFNNTEQHENDTVEWFIVKKAIVSQQPAAIQKFAKNQLFKMKNDTLNADSGAKTNITPNANDLNGKQFKKATVFQGLSPNSDSKRIKAIQEIVNEYDRQSEQLTVQGVKPTQNVDSMNVSDLQTLPPNVIKDIAEKVKRMVLKDILVGDNVTTTTEGATSTITTSEPPSTSLQNDFTQSNHVMQKLMEIFKELKAMKDTAKLISPMSQNDSTVSNRTTIPPQLIKEPQVITSFNPYLMQSPPKFKPIQESYASKVSAPISSGVYPLNKVPQYLPPLNAPPNNDYRSGAITIQTNSDEIAPLPVQITKPSKIMNQHIVLTTNQRAADKKKQERERESIKHVEDKFRLPSEDISHREKIDDQSDLPKNVRFAEKHEVRDRYSYRGGYLDREKPLYHEYHEKVHNIEHPVRSRFPELHYPGRLAHLEHSGRPRDLSTSEDSSPPRGYNRPSFNSGHKSSIRHHPGLYRNGRDRQPRYEATKFHEKLERIENWPRSNWKDFHSPSDSSNDEISARQQMPLAKTKKRTRYDDTHFTNFLKSQQKVTDMLEKILANNLKNNEPQSNEAPLSKSYIF